MKKWAAPIAVLIVLGLISAFVISFIMSDANKRVDGEELDTLEPPQRLADDPASDPAYAQFYGQQPDWVECGEDGQVLCARVDVPLDWDNPDAGAIDLAMVKLPATGEKQGSLLLNPGGPGASGVSYVGDYGDYVVTSGVRKAYDLIGFDPRGVGQSESVDCVSDAELESYLFDDNDPETDAGWEASRESAEKFAQGCEQKTGPLLEFVDTVSAAKDMDVIRAVTGDERLNYVGRSYGTLLGAAYADEFAPRVGRMVLDGALDPELPSEEVALGQAKGMQAALDAYLIECLDGRGCPFEGTVQEANQRIVQWLREVDEQPMDTGEEQRPLTAPRAIIGIVTPLYSQAQWPQLTDAFEAAFAGDGSAFLELSDAYTGRLPDGSYSSNVMEAFYAVTCADGASEIDREATNELTRRAIEAAPVFGEYLVNGVTACEVWPHEARGPSGPLTAAGAPPILVVGTTNDPATPYAWSQALAEQLESGRLLTYEGEGHTAYVTGSRCVDRAVDDYLLGARLPEPGAAC